MANYNIQMQYFNGSEYDVLYPNIPLSAVNDWNDNIYSKNEINNKIGNANYSMNLIGTYIVKSSRNDTGGSTSLPNIFNTIFDEEYEGFYFVINYMTNIDRSIPFYILKLEDFSICPIYGTNNTEFSIVIFLPIVAKTIRYSNEKYLVANSFYTINNSGELLVTAEVRTNNSMGYIDLLQMGEVTTNQKLRLTGIRQNSFNSVSCTATVSIYKYKLNLNT